LDPHLGDLLAPLLLETDLFVDDLFAFPTLVQEPLDLQTFEPLSSVSEWPDCHPGTETHRFILTHEDFRISLDDHHCNHVLDLLKYDISHIARGIEDWDSGMPAFANFVSLSESAFGEIFAGAFDDLLEHYSEDRFPIRWYYNSTRAFTEAPLFGEEQLQMSRDRWCKSCTELLQLLQDNLQPASLNCYDMRKTQLLLLFVLFMMLLIGKARGSPLESQKVFSCLTGFLDG